MNVIYLCAVCELKDMPGWKAIGHSERTGHKYIFQTPEAILEQGDRMRLMAPERKTAIVERVEGRFNIEPYIIGKVKRLEKGIAYQEGCKIAAMGVGKPLKFKVREMFPTYDEASVNEFLEAWG